ncbi:hypothetical protein CALVIDRAFT_115329 [Calocera viscosa TUFC12733]|uniref:F-box domain-containing protein n=1 Tax=Calocera viscosa (strain TUFC12733) TaxID=1330018 RepID=A0A167M6Y4_CALVF|nr:hypothetical protein CALVIDRAFT_115329 [Calocera viscosa TUFC12733]
MAQTLATLFGDRLRYLCLGNQMSITIQLAEKLLACMRHLELCRFQSLQAAFPFPLDPGERERHPTQAPGDSTCNTKEEEAEYRTAKRSSAWPTKNAKIRLPLLRTLECADFPLHVRDWDLPALTEVIVDFGAPHALNSIFRVLQEALEPHAERITHFTYDSIILFDIWNFAPRVLPHLQHLKFQLNRLLNLTQLTQKLSQLTHITINRPAFVRSTPETVLDNIATNLQLGMLPALRMVTLTGFVIEKETATSEQERFSAWNVILQIPLQRDVL